ncbi:MAG: hypothetical protein LBL58_13635 [Tannerellaceae bacterium]|jgi:hypothetical protein|nr:hypothetical protein [Tannerellaceae bacterium]
MDILVLSGFVGALFSVLAFFMPEKFKSNRAIKITFIVLLIGLCCIITFQYSKLKRIENISKSATTLIKSKEFSYTHKSFVQAGLAFLEQNKDLYPDSYERARNLYDEYKKKENPYASETVDIASEIEGIIRGIAVLNMK